MNQPSDSRVDASRRLKAARMLRGRWTGAHGVQPLPVLELSELLSDNNISKNRIEEIEQCKTDARPIELEAIATALNLPEGWFRVDFFDRLDYAATAKTISDLTDRLEALRSILVPRPDRDHGEGSTGEGVGPPSQ